MSVFRNWLEPAPAVEPLEDQEAIDKEYKYWRLRVFYSIYIGYIFYYFTRKSFTFAMPSLITDLGLEKSDLGILGSVLAITYGVSKFCSGILGDRSNARVFMASGLIITGVLNIFFGLSSWVVAFALLWGLNGWFQGWGWPPCVRTMTHWYSQKERGTRWGFWATAHNIGGAAIALFATACSQYLGWRYAMFLPGVISIFAGFWLLNRLRDTPQSLGLPPIEQFKGEEPKPANPQNIHHEKELTVREILFQYVLPNRAIWILAFAYFFVYVIRTGVTDWSVLFLVEAKGYSQTAAGQCITWFEVGGLFGILLTGWASDRIFKGKRGPLCTLFSAAVVLPILGFWWAPASSAFLNSLYMGLIGFFIFGPQMLVGLYTSELTYKKAAATANGFAGCFGYLGAATAGYPLAKIAQIWGWGGFYIAVAFCGIIATLLFVPVWSVKKQKKLACAS